MEEQRVQDEQYMREALHLARKAAQADDTPIGAVIVYQGRIIGRGYNKRNAMGNPLCHAEIEAIHQAAGEIGDWRLENTTIYITLEPCPMCAGAIVQARIPRVVIGAMIRKLAAAGSVIKSPAAKRFESPGAGGHRGMRGRERNINEVFFCASERKRKSVKRRGTMWRKINRR